MFHIFFLQTNSHCNYFEWIDDKESDFQGKESESEVSGGKRVEGRKRGEEDEVCLKMEKIILDLIKKNEKLKDEIATLVTFVCYIVGLNNCNGCSKLIVMFEITLVGKCFVFL